MRTITVTEKHKAVNEGRMSKSEFVRQMRQSYPMYISPQNGYDATVQILKNKQMLFEEKEYEVDDTFKYSDDSLRRAIDIELEAMGLMSHETISMEDQVKAKKKAIANLKKDPLHYYHLISGDSSKVNKHDKPVEVKKGNEVDTFNGMKKATLKEAKQNLEEGTRALVGYLAGNRLTTAYNHYDGYPSGLGKGLMTHYNNDDLAKDIAMKGYITSMDPDSGEISQTHQDPPKKITLPEDSEEMAREVAEEIDGMGADYGYIWHDEMNQWHTIKNTGIRSMIDQITDKMGVQTEVEEDIVPAEEAVAEPTLKERLREALSDPAKLKIAKAIKAKYPIITARDIDTFLDMHGKDIDNGADPMDEFEEFFHANYEGPSDMEEKRIRVRKEGLDADFAPSPNSDVMDANAEDYDVATAFKKARVDMSKPVTVIHSYGHAQYADSDKDEMSAEAAIKKLEAERQDRSKQYTDDGEKVPEDHHGYEYENYSILDEEMPEGHEYKFAYFQTGDADYAITQEKSGVSEKKGKDHDGDGDIDSDDYMAAKDKAIKKAMGKEVEELKEYSDDDDEQEWREEFPNAIKYSWEQNDGGVEAVDDYIDNLFSRGKPDISKEEAMEMMGRPDDETAKAFNQAFITQMQETDDTGGQYDDYQYTINLLYAYEKTYGEPFNTNLIKFLPAYKDEKPKTYDEYKKYVSNLLGKDINESVVRKNLKSIITKVLEEEVINEAATNDLAKIADEYEDFGGLKPAVISLQNIVTEIESFYDKTREKIQKVYDALGNVTNDEGLKVGAFITPSIENAFKRDLKHIIKNQFTGGLNMPQVRRISQDDINRGTVQQEAPKDTVFSPINEKKNKNEK